MSMAIEALVLVTAIGAALIGGVFYAFSSFVMKALSVLPEKQGVAAMQSINIVVLNPSFLILFLGTAIASVAVAIYSITNWQVSSSPYWLAGAAAYLIGTFAVTAAGNVPLNNRLAVADPASDEVAPLWRHYLSRWTRLNSIRTAAATAAALMYVLGMIGPGS